MVNEKLYVIIQMAHKMTDEIVLRQLTYFRIPPRDSLKYQPNVGYSLADGVKFFSTLDDAKENIKMASSTTQSFFSTNLDEKAILEMECNEEKIIQFSQIYKIVSAVLKKERKQLDDAGEFFEITDNLILDLKKSAITPDDLAEGALSLMNEHYRSYQSLQALQTQFASSFSF